MSVQRIVVIADDQDMMVLCQAIIAAGVEPKEIHISYTPKWREFNALGVVQDISAPLILCKGNCSVSRTYCPYCHPNTDHLVP